MVLQVTCGTGHDANVVKMTMNDSAKENVLDEMKSDVVVGNGEAGQWEKLLGNGVTPTVIKTSKKRSQLAVPRMETRRRSSASIFESIHKGIRMPFSPGETDGHVFSR